MFLTENSNNAFLPALPFISLVINVSVISNRVTKMVTQKKAIIRRPIKGAWISS